MRSCRRVWIVPMYVCLSVFFALSSAVCLAGEKASRLTAPTNLPSLREDWKEYVYEAMNKHATEKNRQMNVRYLFLDPPVPCSARVGRKGVLGLGVGKVVLQGYGGVVLKKMIGSFVPITGRRKSVEKDATAHFYLIMPDTGKVEVYSIDQMEWAEMEPPVVVMETKQVRNGREVIFRTMMSPQASVEAAAFRAIADVETFDTWPPYK